MTVSRPARTPLSRRGILTAAAAVSVGGAPLAVSPTASAATDPTRPAPLLAGDRRFPGSPRTFVRRVGADFVATARRGAGRGPTATTCTTARAT